MMSADVMREEVHSPPAGNAEVPNDGNDTGPNAVPYLFQLYALPIHQSGLHHAHKRTTPNDRDSKLRAENTLRRKTPNGTLNGGYSSSTTDANPHKYQVVSLSESNSLHYAPPVNPSVKRTFLQHQQQRSQVLEPTIWNASGSAGWPASQFSPLPSPFPMDSLLHQMPTHPYSAQHFYAQTVPSVLQPSVQYLGPTASGVQGSGPYGPYWHDGTYVPYRPAAVRDPRFYHHHHPDNHHHHTQVVNWSTAVPRPQVIPNAGMWQQTAPPQAQWHSPSIQPWINRAPTAPQTSSPINTLSRYAAPTQSYHNGYLTQPHNQHNVSASHPLPLDYMPSAFPQPVSSAPGPVPSDDRHRDKTFSWALQQYRELLSYIHSTRRQQQQTRYTHGQSHVPQRPSFYPRPPRQSPLGSGFLLNKRRPEQAKDASGDHVRSVSLHNLRSEPTPSDTLSNIGDGLEVSKSRSHSLWSPSGLQFHDNEYQRRASHDQYQRSHQEWPYALHHEADKFRTLRRASGSSVAPIAPPLPTSDSPSARAQAALHQITQLCQETDWQWIDGMHLGGCLAYGLSNYNKALRFYTKVLEMEPKHLEALSNLAATLLALGRRAEAEQHWSKVVKAAPNHFEAVEHLVGLLCNQQRSREAVRVIEYVERSLRQCKSTDLSKVSEAQSSCSSTTSKSPTISELSDKIMFDFDSDGEALHADCRDAPGANEPGFGSSGFSVPASDNGRILALIHAKGNMLYGLGDNAGAARAFEDAVLVAVGRKFKGILGLIKHILNVVTSSMPQSFPNQRIWSRSSGDPLLLTPELALKISHCCFPKHGELPGLQYLHGGNQSLARKAAISTTSNSLLSLAKIFQDSMSSSSRSAGITPLPAGVRDILALYYLSLSLQPSPSTANNVGILLASVQQKSAVAVDHKFDIPGVVPGSGVALALQYYNYGLQLDSHHAHLYTNLGSLLKDIGQLDLAINMYEQAVKCDPKFDIALANLANAVKDKGRINDAITYYKRAVAVSPDFAEAVCGLANALNSVCSWHCRGGIAEEGGKRDMWHVDAHGMLLDGRQLGTKSSGWIKRVIDIVEKQLVDGEYWGSGTLSSTVIEELLLQFASLRDSSEDADKWESNTRTNLTKWIGQNWEGARVARLIERATKRIGWRWYRDRYVDKNQRHESSYNRPQLPASLTTPSAPTVLPFHTFTCPMSPKQIRLISQRNGLRISISTLRAPWLPKQVFPPPEPPGPFLKVGYVSSDFNNHPLAHLMQSVFGLHDEGRVKAHCYATTASDSSIHRQQIQAEAPVFYDASSWSNERLVKQIVQDGIHILINLNGYTRGARNEVFAARAAPIQMSFMGFAGTLGAEWCDYLLADETAVPPDTLRPWRRNIDLEDQMVDDNQGATDDEWVYGENIIYCRDTFFCCDHRQSAPDANETRLNWDDEQIRRWEMRKELFPQIADDTVIFGNFNQLYKIDPTTFRTWLRILARVPNSILWLLRFPDTGQTHLLATARLWAGAEVASRVVFTDVAPKHLHISRARVCDLVLDTAECNAHTTAADVLWSGTPLLTLPRYAYKMCSRMAASILKGALPAGAEGQKAAGELIAHSEEDYEKKAVALGKALSYAPNCGGKGEGRLMELRRLLYDARWTSALFDTTRWVRDLEDAYEEAWRRWVAGEGGDIWLDQVPRSYGREDCLNS